MAASPATTEYAIDAVIRDLGEAITMFDPLRFRAWAELGLTTAQLRVMFLVRETPGVTSGELACKLAVTPPTISGIVDRLEKLSLVRREEDETDRRLVRNILSEKGEASCVRMERSAEIYTRRILVEMTLGELDALEAGLKAFIKASGYVSQVEPNLAHVAMPGVSAS